MLVSHDGKNGMTTSALIGAGRTARGPGMGWVCAGHCIISGSRVPNEKTDLIAVLPAAWMTMSAAVPEEAAIVVSTPPYPEVAPFYGGAWQKL